MKRCTTLCTSQASLKRTRKLVAPSAKNETRMKNANKPARQVHRPLATRGINEKKEDKYLEGETKKNT